MVIKSHTGESSIDLRTLSMNFRLFCEDLERLPRKRARSENAGARPTKRPRTVDVESSAAEPADITAAESTLVEDTQGQSSDENTAFVDLQSMIEFPAAWTSEKLADCWKELIDKDGSSAALLDRLERAASGNRRAKGGAGLCLLSIGSKSGFTAEDGGLHRKDCKAHSSQKDGLCLYIERAPGVDKVTNVAAGTISWFLRERSR